MQPRSSSASPTASVRTHAHEVHLFSPSPRVLQCPPFPRPGNGRGHPAQRGRVQYATSCPAMATQNPRELLLSVEDERCRLSVGRTIVIWPIQPGLVPATSRPEEKEDEPMAAIILAGGLMPPTAEPRDNKCRANLSCGQASPLL